MRNVIKWAANLFARPTNPPDDNQTPQDARYGDWRDEVASNYSTTEIPPNISVEAGLWIDGGRMTGDDASREVVRIAEEWGLMVDDEMRLIVDADGWEDNPEHSEWLTEYADGPATDYIRAIVEGSGFDPDAARPTAADVRNSAGVSRTFPLIWWVGFDGDAGGFGLWIEPDDAAAITNPDNYPRGARVVYMEEGTIGVVTMAPGETAHGPDVVGIEWETPDDNPDYLAGGQPGFTFENLTHGDIQPEPVDDRLEYLRGEIQAERISYGELFELQVLADDPDIRRRLMDRDDIELLQWAGVEEEEYNAYRYPPEEDGETRD